MWLFVSCAVAMAGDISEWFPSSPTTDAELRTQSAALLGPPSSVYDAVTATPGAAKPIELEIEAGLYPRQPAPPDSLRRWGRYMLNMLAKGPVPAGMRWFSAEHMGLPVVPMVLVTFVGGDAAGITKMLRGVEGSVDDLRTAAIVLEPIEGGFRGVVVALVGNADFEPFSRLWAAGDVASVPGTLLTPRQSYALYIAGPGTRVDVFELPRSKGRFDIDVPLAGEPGAYRVTMNAQARNQFPDSAFFFTLYVGVPLPTEAPSYAEAADAPDLEVRFLEILNATRKAHGLAPVERVGDTARLRAFLDGLPQAEGPRLRAWRSFGRNDPLPELAHGDWFGLGATGRTPAEAAWLVTEHPTNRVGLFDERVRYAYLAAADDPAGQQYSVLLLRPPSDAADLRAEAVAVLSARFSRAPTRGPGLEPALDAIADRVARGEIPFNAGLKEVQREVKAAMQKGRIRGNATTGAFTWLPGDAIQTGELQPPSGGRALAVGVATGALGDRSGIRRAVALVVMAEGID